jgi:NADPH2:quinone reductase
VSEQIEAAVLREYGRPPEFSSFDAPPAPSEGQLLLEVEAAGLNPVDVALGENRYTLPAPPVPYVPGIEAVGRVLSSSAPGVSAGERVYVGLPVAPHGTFAASTLAYAAGALPVGDDTDPALPCALGIAGIAAQAALVHRAKMEPGEDVVVLGATGVVGMIAVQVARLLGAGAIVAVGRDAGRLQATRELGATATANVADPELAETLRSASDGGVNVVIDTLCGPPAEAALESMAPGGRLVQLGRSAAETMQISSGTVRGRALSILGHTNFLTPPEVRRAGHEWLLRHAEAGELRVEVERVPLREVADAWRRQKDSPGVKLVLTP